MTTKRLTDRLAEPVDASSLAFFRITFGSVMLFSQLRFLWKGWVEALYIRPEFHFKYYGFYWIQTLPGKWMYLPWIAIVVSLVFVILGKYYRVAIAVFFLLFSYTELLDLANYLNHYYLVTLLSFLMIFLPMNSRFSLDAANWKQPASVPRWTLTALRLQVGLVYFFAGLSKLKYDWLIAAEPLKIWLGTCQNIAVVGGFLAMPITAYVFSWVGMLFDLTAPFLLLNKRTRPFEYAILVVFHLATVWLFYIGIFPLVMTGFALIFFSPAFHRRVMDRFFFWLDKKRTGASRIFSFPRNQNVYAVFLIAFFLWQFLMPLRSYLYKGNVLWTEQGFRYSWNVMLMEKDGYVEYYVRDKLTDKKFIEYPKKHLTPLQEKMMATQPDMILQYAHFLGKKYRDSLGHEIAVYADAYVSLNRKPGQMFIDPAVDLVGEDDTLAPKEWIKPEKTGTR